MQSIPVMPATLPLTPVSVSGQTGSLSEAFSPNQEKRVVSAGDGAPVSTAFVCLPPKIRYHLSLG